MKKKLVIVSVVLLVCLFSALLIWNLTDCAALCVNGKETKISFSDSVQLRRLLIMKETDFIEYACGFSEDYSIKIGGLTYCLAQDDCNSVYIKELDFYYGIHESNHIKLHELLLKYA